MDHPAPVFIERRPGKSMFKKIAVPQDGSPLAEKALPYAMRLAHLLDAKLLLLTVVHGHNRQFTVDYDQQHESLQGYSPDNYPDDLRQYGNATFNPSFTPGHSQILTATYNLVEEAETHLTELKSIITDPGTPFCLPLERVEFQVVADRPVEELAAVAAEQQADLIVMTTHGRSGLPLLVMGSVATAIIQHSTLPVILLRPTDLKESTTFKTVELTGLGRKSGPLVVALDGSVAAETALEGAKELARQNGAVIHLVEVLPSIMPVRARRFGISYDVYDPLDPSEETAFLEKEAGNYLENVQARLREEGFSCIKAVLSGHPATKIVEYASQQQSSLICMATHARGRLGQVLLGSVAEAVVRESHLPVMLTRIEPK